MNTIQKSYDAVIIGAGVGGGAMANRLAKAGAKVLVIERGIRLPREADNWSVKAVFHERRYATRETWRDRDGIEFNPSTYYYVGGNSKFFGTATVRFRAQDFEDLQHEAGVAPAWPISYADLAPYYDVAEQLFGTHGTAGMDPCEPPRSGPMPHPAIGHEPEIQVFDTKLREMGLRPFPLPVAIDLHPGGKCIRCRTCDGFACKLGAKNDAEVRMVDPAIETGNVDLVLETLVRRLITDDSGRKVVAVEIEQAGQTRTIQGDLFVSSAGAINSAALLLRSANARHPKGLGNNSSDQLGRNYMAHNNTAMMAVNPFKKNNVVFQKSLCINDFYLANSVKPYPWGTCRASASCRAACSPPTCAAFRNG
jgi:choline dehydrogenase-like flavoprotein